MTETTKKITKKDNFVEIVNVLENAGREDLAAVIKHEIELLENKATKAKATAASKKTEPDALCELVQAALTDEFATIADITSKVDYDGISISKVQARLNKLVAAEVAVKEQVTIGEGKEKVKRMCYKLAN